MDEYPDLGCIYGARSIHQLSFPISVQMLRVQLLGPFRIVRIDNFSAKTALSEKKYLLFGHASPA